MLFQSDSRLAWCEEYQDKWAYTHEALLGHWIRNRGDGLESLHSQSGEIRQQVTQAAGTCGLQEQS